ncbi:MAG: UDP-3-O-(3-hydroxymyristoyl)glucosamine N-acyltransferase [Saprospiraceae bacterium]|nr:UDP-3-O-(3-hydroxymyristoyl)glucosamine N-acyltransferase [Saprospiraceae bacterium]MDW8483497.1 UDP-3-O-(3-hydroxymyristoyl)glucosamine N-acyltransferase [Saprospiraceae bacterium]
MHLTAAQLAHLLGGRLEGDPNAIVRQPARIEEAQEGDFAFLDNPKYEPFAYTTRASVLLVSKQFTPTQPVSATLIRVDDVRSSLALLLEKFHDFLSANGIVPNVDEHAWVHTDARIGTHTYVGPFAIVEAGAVVGEHCIIHPQVYIGRNARIGDHCVIYPGVRILHHCVIGNRCTIYPNAVIGSDGFGFAPQEDGSWKRIPHVGNVVLEDDVEIGANTCIDRAALGSTLIRAGVKIDNLVHIAHNVEVGRNTAMAAQVGIAGSAKIGENVQLGGQVGIAGHLTIADGTRVQAQSGVASSVKKTNQALFGSPAIDYNDYLRAYIIFKKLPELQRKVDRLERMLNKDRDFSDKG